MILEETLNKLIRDIVNLLLLSPGYTIKSKPNHRRPTGSYGDVQFMSDISVGTEQRVFENNIGDEDITENITGMRQIMFSVGFYRDNARDNARSVRTRLIRESIQSIFRSANVGLTSRSEVSDVVSSINSIYISGRFESNLISVPIEISI